MAPLAGGPAAVRTMPASVVSAQRARRNKKAASAKASTAHAAKPHKSRPGLHRRGIDAPFPELPSPRRSRLGAGPSARG